MLLMPRTNIDFQGLADRIASDFLEKGTPLEDGIVSEAKRRSMKPEEVKRLVEKTNTACSIKMMRSSDDKKRVFALASKDSVLAKTHPVDDLDGKAFNDDGSEKTDSVFPTTRKEEKTAFIGGVSALAGLYMPAMLGVALYGGKKMRDITKATAAANIKAKKEIAERMINRATLVAGLPIAAAAGTSAVNDVLEMSERADSKKTKMASIPTTPHMVFQLKHDIETLRQQKVATELRLQDTINKLCHMKAAEFHEIASEYLSCGGSATEPYLTSIAEYIGAEPPFQKEASFVDDTTAGYALCRSLEENHDKLIKVSEQLAEYEEMMSSAYAVIAEKAVI